MPSLNSTSAISQSLPVWMGIDTPIDEKTTSQSNTSLIRGLSIGGKRAVELGSTAKSEFAISRHEVDNSTALQADSDFINREASFLLDAAGVSELGDAQETQFYDQLHTFIARYQEQAVDALTASIFSHQNKLFAVSKSLEAIGSIDSAPTITGRFWMLQRGLFSSSSIIRYGAALGFGSLREPRAIPLLEQAAEREPNAEIKTALHQVIAFLKASR